MHRRRTFGLLGLLALLTAGLIHFRRHILGRFLRLSPVRYRVALRRGLRLAMADGVELVADHYYPADSRLQPTILIRTPYGRNGSAGMVGMLIAFIAGRFAERGYNVIVQDVRGRFDSAGEFQPFVHEAGDGRATLAWIESQPWFNGMLGMWGPSYMGYTQWATAVGAPLYLKALMPVTSGAQLPVIGARDQAFAADMLLRWIFGLEGLEDTRGLRGFLKFGKYSPMTQEKAIARGAAQLPLSQADQATVGRTVPFFQEWLVHRSADEPYWQPVIYGKQVSSVTAAVHLVGGWHDIMLRETLDDYQALRAAGRQPYLTIGPWTHLDQTCQWESLRQGIAWFDAYLKGDRRGLRARPVRVYMLGEDSWREFAAWPPETQPLGFYLQGDRGLAQDIPPEDTPPDQYLYDPRDPTPALGGAMMNTQAGVQDNRPLERRPDVLTFTTPPLEGDLDVLGSARLELFVRSSLEHTDFFARLCDVLPDGRSLNICDGFIRLVPGRGALQPDGSLRLEIEFWATACRFKRGHCLRLQLSSGAHPRWARNPGTGEPIASAVHLEPAQQTIYHDVHHPSRLVLPVNG